MWRSWDWLGRSNDLVLLLRLQRLSFARHTFYVDICYHRCATKEVVGSFARLILLDGFYGDAILNLKTVASALLVLASALLVLASAC